MSPMCFELSLSEFNISPRSELVASGVTVTKPPLFIYTCTNHTASLFPTPWCLFRSYKVGPHYIVINGVMGPENNWVTGLITATNWSFCLKGGEIRIRQLPGCLSDSLWELAVKHHETSLSHRTCPWGGHLLKFDSRTPGPTPASKSFTGGGFTSCQGIRFQKCKSSKC